MMMRSGSKPKPAAQPARRVRALAACPTARAGADARKERPLLAGAAGWSGALYVLAIPAIVTRLVGALAAARRARRRSVGAAGSDRLAA
jgi:hypothetical protein